MSLFKSISEKYKSKPRYKKARIFTFATLTAASAGFGIAGLLMSGLAVGVGLIVSALSIATSLVWGIMTARAIRRSVKEGPVDLNLKVKLSHEEKKQQKQIQKEEYKEAKFVFFFGNNKRLKHQRYKQLEELKERSKTAKENYETAAKTGTADEEKRLYEAAQKEYSDKLNEERVKTKAVKTKVKEDKRLKNAVKLGDEEGNLREIKTQLYKDKDMKAAIKRGAVSYRIGKGLALFNTTLSLAIAGLVAFSPFTDSLLKTYSAGDALANESGVTAQYDDAQLKNGYVNLGAGITALIGSGCSIYVATAGIKKRKESLIAANKILDVAGDKPEEPEI